METNQELKERHLYSIKGIFPKYIIKKFLSSYSIYVSIGITIGLYLLIIFSQSENTFVLLREIIELTLNLLPNILGFCIGGYALIIGIGNIDALKKMSLPMKKRDDLSFFQILSSVFAGSLVLQCVTLLFSFIINIILKLEIPAVSNQIATIINSIVIISVLFLSTLSIILLYYTVINLFNYGQSMHFLIRLEKREQDEQH